MSWAWTMGPGGLLYDAYANAPGPASPDDPRPEYGPQPPPRSWDADSNYVPDAVEDVAAAVGERVGDMTQDAIDQAPSIAGAITRNFVGTTILTTAVVLGLGYAAVKLMK